MMSPAAEHVGSSHDDKGLPTRHDKTRIEVDQKRRFSVAFGRCPAPVRKALRLNPAQPFHSAQVLVLRRNEYQARAGDASRLIDECPQLPSSAMRPSKSLVWDGTQPCGTKPSYAWSGVSSLVFQDIRALFLCDRPPPRSCSASCWRALVPPHLRSTWLARNSRTNSTVFHVPDGQVAPTWDQ